MSNQTTQSPQKKGLGRGLGSLLGGSPNHVENPAPKAADVKPKSPIPVAPPAPVKTASFAPQKAEAPKAAPGATSAPTPVAATPAAAAIVADSVPGVVSKVDTVLSQDNLEAKVWSIPIEKIVANPHQPRKTFEPEKLKELAASIKSKGVLQPIAVRKAGLIFEIIAGERRWRASQQAGLHEVPAIVRSASDQDSLELALIENIQRHELNPIEEARAYQELQQKFHLTHDQISERVGKERATITNTLRLLSLPANVLSMVADGRLSTGHAKVLLGAGSSVEMEKLANEVLKKKLSVRKLELEIKRKALDEKVQNVTLDHENKIMLQLIRDLEEDLQKRIGTKVKINYQNHQGSIDISFYSDDQLTEIAERIKDSWKPGKNH